MKKLLLLAAACGLALTFVSSVVIAQSDGQSNQSLSNSYVQIGVISDLSGVYKDIGGPGTIVAVKMAIDDFGGKVLGVPIEMVSADYQSSPARAASIARRWADKKGVDMIVNSTNSAAALALWGLSSAKDFIVMDISSGTTKMTEGQCTEYGIHYVYDTHALAVGTATAIVKNGGDTWFFITADYEFGHSLQENTAEVVKSLGGNVLGSVAAPMGTTDFASYLIQAKSSGAEVVGLANAGADFINSVKQAYAFHIVQSGQQLAALLAFLPHIKSLGLTTAQGLKFTTAFYWKQDEEAREWSKRFFEKQGSMPTMAQAGAYSATMTYLKAIKKAGTDDPDAVREVLGNMTINDMFVDGGDILPNGLMMHDMYLVQVKSPEESEAPWDLLKVIERIPGKDAFIPLSKSSCPLLKQ